MIETTGFDHDNLHMVTVIPVKCSIASVMDSLKNQSPSMLSEKTEWFEKLYWKENTVWSTGYCVSSVGVDEPVIKRYDEHQGAQASEQLRMQL